MNKPGRKKKYGEYVQFPVLLPKELNAELDLLLFDPVAKRIRYGARTNLIQRLIINWIESQKRSGEVSANDLTPPAHSAINISESTPTEQTNGSDDRSPTS